MQSLTPSAPHSLNIKRHLSLDQGFTKYYDISSKKIKNEILVKMEENAESLKPAPAIEIPPLILTKSTSAFDFKAVNSAAFPQDDSYLEQLKSLYLIKQNNLFNQYNLLLSINRLAEQNRQLYRHKSALSISRGDSNTSSASFSTSGSFSNLQVPILMKKKSAPLGESFVPPLINIPKFNDPCLPQSNKKAAKVSACKNYIALLCTGFARSVLTANPDSQTFAHLHLTILHKKVKYGSLTGMTDDELKAIVIDHIHKDICGKRVKKTNKGRDFKVRNTEELEILLSIKEGDDELTCFRKEVLKEMMQYFFVSSCYEDWLNKGMINEANKSFFLKNKMEIQKKFANPIIYKPHFDYNAAEH